MKILLIEDRQARQQIFINKTHIELESYMDILDNKIGEMYNEIHVALQNDTYDLSEYSVIITHKSAFGDNNAATLSKLESHCKAHDKPLVYFSGGIDVSYYNKSENEVIALSSELFYSNNLKLFLENCRTGKINLLTLIYGEKWELNIQLNVLAKINLFIENWTKEQIIMKRFISETAYDLLADMDIDLYEPAIVNNKIEKSEISKIAQSLENHIKEVVYYA